MAKIESILNEIKESNLDITSNCSDWFKIACVISKVYGEDGRNKFHQFSQFSSKYNEKECNRQYDACLKKEYGHTIGSLIYILNEYK